ncbi:MAG TPA: PDDEXK nuclease domain-containing protein [Chitinophagaceae bacterium]|nr:PDDEXK nuclease domain-containing protein [Chitinophagaceae bacterium]
MIKRITSKTLFTNIRQLIQKSKEELHTAINHALTLTYFHVGRLIVEYEQGGASKAAYASKTLTGLSKKLNREFGRGFSVDNLENMRAFYLTYKQAYEVYAKKRKSETLSRKLVSSVKAGSQKSETLSRKSFFLLSWSHYMILLKIENRDERKFYEIEAINEQWSIRELKRQYDSALYERLVLSRNKKKVRELSKKGHVISTPSDAIKDPYILEFLNLSEKDVYTENDFECAIIDQLENFLKELGKGFLFVDRQKRIRMDGEDYFIDLVFYHRILRCFVLIDLKIGTLKHQDLGQLQMYVNYYDEQVKAEEENKTIGIILCKSKKENIIRYTLGSGNRQIFASKYKMFFPEKQVLKLLQAQHTSN